MMKTMKTDEFFDRLLLLPLFQGIGRNDFMEIAERIRLGFQRQRKGQVLVSQDDLCSSLLFILDGEIRINKKSDAHNYELNEWTSQPLVLQPESLFGLSTRYTRTFTTETAVHILKVNKDAVRDILFYYPTFRINFLNLLSMRVQLANRQLWRPAASDLPLRFVQFLSSRCLRPAGRKELRISMQTLADELLTTRLNVSQLLNSLAQEGLIELKRERIFVPSMEKLLMGKV